MMNEKRQKTVSRAAKIKLLECIRQGSTTTAERQEIAELLGIEQNNIQLVYAGSEEEARKIMQEVEDDATRRGINKA